MRALRVYWLSNSPMYHAVTGAFCSWLWFTWKCEYISVEWVPRNRTAMSLFIKPHISQSDCINLHPQASHESSNCPTPSLTFQSFWWVCGDTSSYLLWFSSLRGGAHFNLFIDHLNNILWQIHALVLLIYISLAWESCFPLPQPGSLIDSDASVLTGFCLCTLSPSHSLNSQRDG